MSTQKVNKNIQLKNWYNNLEFHNRKIFRATINRTIYPNISREKFREKWGNIVHKGSPLTNLEQREFFRVVFSMDTTKKIKQVFPEYVEPEQHTEV